jgi:hypothetical protein
MDEILTPTQVAERLQVKPSWVYEPPKSLLRMRTMFIRPTIHVYSLPLCVRKKTRDEYTFHPGTSPVRISWLTFTLAIRALSFMQHVPPVRRTLSLSRSRNGGMLGSPDVYSFPGQLGVYSFPCKMKAIGKRHQRIRSCGWAPLCAYAGQPKSVMPPEPMALSGPMPRCWCVPCLFAPRGAFRLTGRAFRPGTRLYIRSGSHHRASREAIYSGHFCVRVYRSWPLPLTFIRNWRFV